MISEEKTVAFDLDMTLVDSRPVSERALQRLVSEHGYDLDIFGVATGTSPPLGADVELDDLHAFAPWLRAQVWLPDPDRISERRHNIEPKVRDAEVSR